MHVCVVKLLQIDVLFQPGQFLRESFIELSCDMFLEPSVNVVNARFDENADHLFHACDGNVQQRCILAVDAP